ncbi:MAG: ATP-binding protein, partial [Candidatus Baltobacteraceae bacterium]
LEGEGGIGKTRLIEEFRRSVGSEAGFGIGYCLEYVRAPYLPFSEIFGQIGLQWPATPAVNGRDATAEDKLAHFSSIAAALQKYAGRRPLILVIEDVQWADDATIDLVQHLCHSVRNARIQLLLTCRSDALQCRT